MKNEISSSLRLMQITTLRKFANLHKKRLSVSFLIKSLWFQDNHIRNLSIKSLVCEFNLLHEFPRLTRIQLELIPLKMNRACFEWKNNCTKTNRILTAWAELTPNWFPPQSFDRVWLRLFLFQTTFFSSIRVIRNRPDGLQQLLYVQNSSLYWNFMKPCKHIRTSSTPIDLCLSWATRFYSTCFHSVLIYHRRWWSYRCLRTTGLLRTKNFRRTTSYEPQRPRRLWA